MTVNEFYDKQAKKNVEYLRMYRIPGPYVCTPGKCHKCEATAVVDIQEDEKKFTVTCGECFEDRIILQVPYEVYLQTCSACGGPDAKIRPVLKNDPSTTLQVGYKEIRPLCDECHALCAEGYWRVADNIASSAKAMGLSGAALRDPLDRRGGKWPENSEPIDIVKILSQYEQASRPGKTHWARYMEERRLVYPPTPLGQLGHPWPGEMVPESFSEWYARTEASIQERNANLVAKHGTNPLVADQAERDAVAKGLSLIPNSIAVGKDNPVE